MNLFQEIREKSSVVFHKDLPAREASCDILNPSLSWRIEEILKKGNLFELYSHQVEAINAVRKLNPDVVVLDIKMPGVDGIDVLKAIKNKNQDIVVIMLTNYPYPQYRKKCIELGADYFFKKSTEFESVIETLKQLI